MMIDGKAAAALRRPATLTIQFGETMAWRPPRRKHPAKRKHPGSPGAYRLENSSLSLVDVDHNNRAAILRPCTFVRTDNSGAFLTETDDLHPVRIDTEGD